MTSPSVPRSITISVRPNGNSASRPEHKQSPVTFDCKPWSTLFNIVVDCTPFSTHDSVHLTSPLEPASLSMDIDHPRSHSPHASADVSSPLLDEPGPRPYQAYCVTEASSRPPSSNSLRPQPFLIQSSIVETCDTELRLLPTEPDPQTPATNVERNSSSAISLGQEKGGNEQETSANGEPSSRNTILAHPHHITQAVTPRGSHSLTTSQTNMYDATPSHLRMQQSSPKHVATFATYQRKPLPNHTSNVGMDHRPLPALPIESATKVDLNELPYRSQTMETTDDYSDQIRQAPEHQVQLGDESPDSEHVSKAVLRRKALHTRTGEEAVAREATYILDSITILPINLCRDVPTIRDNAPPSGVDRQPRQSNACDNQPQVGSAQELYISRGLLSNTDDDRRARRRTQPKDAKLKYQFGHRPSARLEIPLPTPPHASQPKFTEDRHSPALRKRPSSNNHFDQPYISPHIGLKSGPGPRPPPWGSRDNLELRRQFRSDARDREEARKLRDSGSSITKSSDSTDSLRKTTMRREVEKYREQVLRLYPDLEFDGNAGHSGRGSGCYWCLCMVM
jgi:hypothetical protein